MSKLSFRKIIALSLEPTSHKISTPLELIFSDVWGPAPLFSLDGYRYLVIFVDAYTKNIYDIILSLSSMMFTLFLINFRLSLSVNFH
jgi:histone deacetylase 1/2